MVVAAGEAAHAAVGAAEVAEEEVSVASLWMIASVRFWIEPSLLELSS